MSPSRLFILRPVATTLLMIGVLLVGSVTFLAITVMSMSSTGSVRVATAQWSNEKQEWELADTFAQPAHCNTCNIACEIVWLPLN